MDNHELDVFSKENVGVIDGLLAMLQASFEEAKNDPEYNGELDMLIAATANLAESSQAFKKAGNKASMRDKARLAADMNLVMQLTGNPEGDESEFEFEDFDEDEDFDDESEFEEEDEEEEDRPKGKR